VIADAFDAFTVIVSGFRLVGQMEFVKYVVLWLCGVLPILEK
jgi:hypothetical protein